MALKKKEIIENQELVENTIVDYASNMFKDGNNRAERDKKVHDAPAYDAAVNVADPALADAADSLTSMAVADSELVDVARSRDGTEASGIYDEDGGPLGGTPKELDSLEAGGTPVDRNPRMKG